MKEHTRILADFIARLKFEDLSHQVIEKAKECILDTFGCALAGSASEEVAAMIKGIKAYDEGAGSVLWGSNLRSSLFSSCLINGAMAHCLEMDDVHRKAKVHPGTTGKRLRMLYLLNP